MNCSIGGWGEWDGEGKAWEWPTDYSILDTKRSRKCESCDSKIAIGDTCGKVRRFRGPVSEIEENIYGEEVPLAPKYLCEKCTDILFNLEDLGYAVGMMDMNEALCEYKEYSKLARAPE